MNYETLYVEKFETLYVEKFEISEFKFLDYGLIHT